MHTGTRRHNCPLCDKNFRSSSHLKRHLLIHQREARTAATRGTEIKKWTHYTASNALRLAAQKISSAANVKTASRDEDLVVSDHVDDKDITLPAHDTDESDAESLTIDESFADMVGLIPVKTESSSE